MSQKQIPVLVKIDGKYVSPTKEWLVLNGYFESACNKSNDAVKERQKINYIWRNTSELRTDIKSHEDAVSYIRDSLANWDNGIKYFMLEDQVEDSKVDLALVQCFWGQSSERVDAIKLAMSYNLKAKVLPSEWIVVEAQYEGDNLKLEYVEDLGATYVPIVMNHEQDSFFLKPALWNIGAHKSKSKNMLFLDSDVMFCSNDWTSLVYHGLILNDVMSPAEYLYYANLEFTPDDSGSSCIYRRLNETSGKAFPNFGHVGFGIAMSRSHYLKIGGFDCIPCKGEDALYWCKATRSDIYSYPYKKQGLKHESFEALVKVGYAKTICCHVSHGTISSREYGKAEAIVDWNSTVPFDGIDYDSSSDLLPRWKDDIGAKIRDLLLGRVCKDCYAQDNKKNYLVLKLVNSKIINPFILFVDSNNDLWIDPPLSIYISNGYEIAKQNTSGIPQNMLDEVDAANEVCGDAVDIYSNLEDVELIARYRLDSKMFSGFMNVREHKPEANDIAFIQCYFGQDAQQEKAIEKALRLMLLSDPKPKSWIFVEAQRHERHARFKWLKDFGVKYIFKKMSKESEGLFMKEALWNIGAHSCKEDNLVFLDADVVYCNTDWIDEATLLFKQYDIFLLQKFSWRADEDEGLIESICNLIFNRKIPHNFHTGFDVALRRSLFEKINGFKMSSTTGGDFMFYGCMFGSHRMHQNINEWTPYDMPYDMVSKGVLPEDGRIGCGSLLAFHVHHRSLAENRYAERAYLCRSCTSCYGEDFIYDPASDDLPKWANNIPARIHRKLLPMLPSLLKDATEDTYKSIIDNAIQKERKMIQ